MGNRDKSIVLLSGGLDSSVNLFEAYSQFEVVLAITFNYGQRAAKKEVQAAQSLSDHLGILHKVVDLSFFSFFTSSSLLDESKKVPIGFQVDLNNEECCLKTASAVWVPNRNGIFLNIAAGFAEGLKARWIIPGFNKEEATTFPDNSEDFIFSINESLKFSTQSKVKVFCFTSKLNKSDIALRGQELNLPFQIVWPCYFGGEMPCLQCESCLRYQRATRDLKL